MRSESVFHPSARRVFARSHKLRFALMAILCFLFPVASILRVLYCVEAVQDSCLCKLFFF